MPNCSTCKYKGDLNRIDRRRDPSRMFKDNRCFYGLDKSFKSVKDMDADDIPDIKYNMYDGYWVTVGFKCPLEEGDE